MEDWTSMIPDHSFIMHNNSFTLFKELSSSTEGNVFVSTYSIQLLLLLLTFGSKSSTYDQLKSVLHLPKDVLVDYEAIQNYIPLIDVPGYLTVSNAIFSDKEFSLSTDYANKSQTYLNSKVFSVDFSVNPTSGESEINTWVNKSTNGKISELYKPGVITKDTVLVLASAVHFQDVWKNQFTNTENSSFCLTSTNHIDVQMMHQIGLFNYYKNDNYNFSAVELPYQVDGFEMLIILPDKMDGLNDLEELFMTNYENYVQLLDNMTTHKVILDIPKFRFDSDLNLQYTMEKLGCTEMFSSRANFSGMGMSKNGKLSVTRMIHKTFVDVNEKGTEAAAVTSAKIGTRSGNRPVYYKTVKFHACHPFLFIIKKDDYIIFMGRLSNPNA